MMHYLAYVSTATKSFEWDALYELLRVSRKNNVERGITGMLLYKTGRFMQLLEGEQPAVEAIYDIIRNDPRHRGVFTVITGETETRNFPEWSMAFQDLNADDGSTIPGYCDFLKVEFTPEYFGPDPSLSQRMLLTYKALL